MTIGVLWIPLVLLAATSYLLGRKRAVQAASTGVRLHSRPTYYGTYVALWCLLPAVGVAALWIALEPWVLTHLIVRDLPDSYRHLPPDRLGLVLNDVKNLATGAMVSGEPDAALRAAADHYRSLRSLGASAMVVACFSLALLGLFWSIRRVRADFRARNQVERVIRGFLILSATLAVFTTVGIVLSVLFEALRFFRAVPPWEFFFGLQWSPQMAIRADQVGSSGAFGMIPVFTGTMLISAIAMGLAVPVGLFSAIYLSEYASRAVRAVVKPLLEILAGVPTVVYGFFAALTVGPTIRHMGEWLGLEVASESALAAGLVMGIMIIPFISSLSDDVINAVPQDLRDGSLALGATRSETIRQVVLPAALPGIMGGVLLGVSRAIGETMIVVMAAGLSANLTMNPLQAVTTVTVQIVTLLVGDQEFDSPKTLAAFALGLVLFLVTLVLNVISLAVVRRYREQYE
ncbi:phosphate ABC transporter membrane protein 1, PhoT family (TC 3.A.1.7.1) [Desulfacinum hydrothermale DSM 13146]|uniref:Phosphate transport system permease protein n=1 Tax=Desulfacinum hydrothermale DSM 13146 TaxID=1121390 RepID=A0A1W1XRV6_9BACT|nr:phosphate ABC transporter permease subunit PstC [Desulfacinum hydrothermale]SMC26594.1 phosphate ABC transporter membrane protein 1, PhoT family (TC 3.A.1.7.1) [Desulfacinum hydrothermale DSM 13146]